MATIINTLEVLLEQPSPQAGAPAAPPKPPSAPLTPRDLEDVMERQMRTVVRLAAH